MEINLTSELSNFLDSAKSSEEMFLRYDWWFHYGQFAIKALREHGKRK